MGIWDRLGSVIKSYLNDNDSSEPYASNREAGNDPDLDAAYEELNDFLGEKGTREKPAEKRKERAVPAELKDDFAELGLSLDASPEECKSAYKRLLKVHHPDRHAGNPEALKKATEKTARLNASYKHLERWFQFSS